MEKASDENRVIVTNDEDFGELAVREGKDSEGIILLRLQVETPSNKVKVMRSLIEEHKDRIQGNLLVVREDSTKARKI